ncbi:MAG: hypothetical protein AVDCRST_MAG73-3359, partial [uncultured Thermomicrobiales bacterium]
VWRPDPPPVAARSAVTLAGACRCRRSRNRFQDRAVATLALRGVPSGSSRSMLCGRSSCARV